MGCIAVYSRCDKSLDGVVPPRIYRMGSTLVCSGCRESLQGVDPLRIHCVGCETSLDRMQ